MTLYLAFRPDNEPALKMFHFALRDITCLHTLSSTGNEQTQTHVGYVGCTAPLSVVSLFYRDPQRPLIIGQKLKENTATPNHEHNNQRQQVIHVFTTVPFRDIAFSKVSAKLPPHQIQRFPSWKLYLAATYWSKFTAKNKRCGVCILILSRKFTFP